MAFKDIVNSGIGRISARLGNPLFTWNGEDYICVPSSAGEIRSLEEGGFSVDADLVLTIKSDSFTDGNIPKSQQKLTYRNRGYRIITVKQDASTAIIRLFCQDDSRGI